MHRVRMSLILLVICTMVVGAGSVGAAPERAPRARPLADVLGGGFTYQGQLKQGGTPLTDACNFQFTLWDAATSGSQVGPVETRLSLPVTGGLFTAEDLDFGAAAFDGDARWLEIGVMCTGDSDYVALSPRQVIAAAPYALYAPEAGSAESADYATSAGSATSATNATNATNATFATSAGSAATATNATNATFATSAGSATSATSALSAASAPWSGLTGVPPGFADDTDNVGTGTVISVGTGAGLTGGPITTSGTISLATGGVTSAHIANGAILAEDLFDGAALAEILDDAGTGSGLDADLLDGQSSAYYQRALSGACSAGSAIRQINPDGSVTCETDDNTIYTNGAGILLSTNQFSANFTTAGGENGSATTVSRGDHIHDSDYVNEGQSLSITSGMIVGDAVSSGHIANGTLVFADWASNSCGSNQIPRWSGSAWACVNDSLGSVTAVGTGTGLTGGPITTTGTISLAPNGVTSSHINNGELVFADWSSMGCLNNQIPRFNGSAWVCATDSTGTVTSVGTSGGLTGGPITGSGTISIGTGGVTSTHILDETITNFDIQNGSVIFADWYHNGCTGGQIPQYSGSAWGCVANTPGTVTAITATSGLSGGTITTTGSIGILTGGVTSTHISDGTITSVDLSDGTARAEILDDDGTGSLLDADLLDGYHVSDLSPATHAHSSLNASDGAPSNAVYVDSEGHVGLGTMTPGADVLSVNGSARVSGLLTLPYVYNYSNVLTGLGAGGYVDIPIETVTGSAFYLATTYNSFSSTNTKLRAWIWAEALDAPFSNSNKYWVRVENIGAATCTDYDWVQVVKFGGY